MKFKNPFGILKERLLSNKNESSHQILESSFGKDSGKEVEIRNQTNLKWVMRSLGKTK